jgi:hypothetical protein
MLFDAGHDADLGRNAGVSCRSCARSIAVSPTQGRRRPARGCQRRPLLVSAHGFLRALLGLPAAEFRDWY